MRSKFFLYILNEILNFFPFLKKISFKAIIIESEAYLNLFNYVEDIQSLFFLKKIRCFLLKILNNILVGIHLRM